MAFQAILDTLSSTIHRDTIVNPILESQIEPLRKSIQQFPYKIPQTAVSFFLNNGIAISGYGSKPHPHPIHKTLELNLLRNIWPTFSTAPSTVLFMKESKFNKLQKLNPNFTKLNNYLLTARDSSRYNSTSDELPSTSQCFMHDALMYFEPSQILDLFLKSNKLEKLFASIIVPPESIFSTNFSFHPNIYRYNVSDGTLHYYLETNQAHSYSQPASAIQWLQTTKIVHPELTITISVLDSFGPMHHLLIQRGEPPISPDQDQISFHHPECILLPAPNDINQNIAHRLIPSTVYHALFTYVRAVRTLRITDPSGFVRTQSNKPEHAWVHSAAWDNLQQFAVLTAPYRPINHYFLFRSPLARFLHLIKTHHFKILQASTVASTSIIATTATAISRLFTHRISSLTILRAQVISPPSSITQKVTKSITTHLSPILPKAKQPLFQITLTRKPNLIFGRPIPKFLKLNFLSRFITTPSIPKTFIIAATITSLIPAILLAHRWLSGPDSPQSIHDEYIRYFHPTNFQLTIDRKPLLISCPKPFLTHASIPEVTNASHPTPIKQSPPNEVLNACNPNSSTHPTLAPTPPSPIPIASTPQEPTPHPTSNPFSENYTPIQAYPIEIPTSTPIHESSPTASTEPLEPMFEFPTFETADPNRIFSLNDPDHPPTPPASPTPEDTAPVEVTPSQFGTFQQHLPHVPPETTPKSPLEDDPSAVGPITLFSELVPLPFVNHSGDFLTRRRQNWEMPLPPYPTNTDCLLQTVSKAINVPPQTLWNDLCHILPNSLLNDSSIHNEGLLTDHLTALSSIHRFSCTVHSKFGAAEYGIQNAPNHFHIIHSENPSHFEFSVGPPNAQMTNPIQGASSFKKALLEFKFQDSHLPIKTVHRYSVNVKRAKNLISNMKNGFDGIISQIDPNNNSKGRETVLALDRACDVASKKIQTDLIHISGFAGCGKTKPITALLKRKDFSQYRIVVPTTELRAEWKTLLNIQGPQSWRVSTWESALLKTASILVIDEVYKLPRGYIDLALIADPTIQLVIVLGDPLQGEYHSSSASSTNHLLSSEIHHLLPYIDHYCLWSYRIPQNVAKFFNVKSFNSQPGFAAFTRQINIHAPVLACSANSAKTLQQCGYHAITIASSQGSTYTKPLTILLDRNCNLLSPHHTLVALTRSKTGIFFSGDLSILSAANQNPMLQAFSSSKPINLTHTFNDIFSKLPILEHPIRTRRTILRGGSQAPHSSHVLIPSNLAPIENLPNFQKLPITNSSVQKHQSQIRSYQPTINPVSTSICNPDFQGDVLLSSKILLGNGECATPQVSTHFLPPARRPLHFDIPSAEPSSTPIELTNFTPSPHEPVYPGIEFQSLAATFLPAIDPEAKEIYYKDMKSNQFPYLDHPQLLGPQPISLLAPIHNGKNDPTLLISSISKRLRFRESTAPYQISPQDTLLGQLLFESLCRARKRNPNTPIPFNPALFIECINLNEFAQLTSKTQKVIMSNAFRSDPDWRWTSVRIFSKTQHKVNEGTIFGPWKACQTLALMHDAIILILGPVKKYQRIIDAADQPDNIYVHAGNTPFQLSSWCQTHMTNSLHLANDYTSFDQSQHGEAVVLEALKMRYVSIPDNIIHLHCFIKTSIETQFGPLTCMRLTGEPGTYDDNTDYNLAVLYSQYHITNQAVLISGDDSLIDSLPPIRPSWTTIEPLLSLKFKTELSPYGLFCGYYVGPQGACRSPKALFAKLAIAFDDGTHYEKLPSYITEFSIGHSLGDSMWNLFPAEQVMFQSANFDYFCRFASRSQKVLLRLGEPDPSAFSAIADQIKHASYALFSLMSSSARTAYLKIRNKVHFPSNPEIESIQRELLSFSILTPCQQDCQTTSITQPHPPNQPLNHSLPPTPPPQFRGGSSLSTKSNHRSPLPRTHHQDPPHLIQSATKANLTIQSSTDSSPPTAKHQQPSFSSTQPMESALLSLLSSALPALLSKSSSSTSDNDSVTAITQSGSVPLPGTHDAVVSAPKSAPPPTHSLRPPPTVRPLRTDLIRHFQWNAYDLTGVETGTTTIDIITKAIITNLSNPYQTARLVQLEACVMPTHNAIKYPVTIELLWAPANAAVPEERIMSTYGSCRFVAGSLMNPSEHMIAPCDLQVSNPTVKSSVTFTDSPKLYLKFWENADSKKLGINALTSASVFIRGSLELTAPITCATY